MDREAAVATLARLHAAQNALYGGAGSGPVRDVLHPDVVWVIPGSNAISGTYRGAEEVLRYMERRRDLAGGSFRMHPREILTGEGDLVAVHTDGTAVIGGREVSWSTVGLYRIEGGRIAACWLLPLDLAAFDRVWEDRGTHARLVSDADPPRRPSMSEQPPRREDEDAQDTEAHRTREPAERTRDTADVEAHRTREPAEEMADVESHRTRGPAE